MVQWVARLCLTIFVAASRIHMLTMFCVTEGIFEKSEPPMYSNVMSAARRICWMWMSSSAIVAVFISDTSSRTCFKAALDVVSISLASFSRPFGGAGDDALDKLAF